jgi:hypothetical protein
MRKIVIAAISTVLAAHRNYRERRLNLARCAR